MKNCSSLTELFKGTVRVGKTSVNMENHKFHRVTSRKTSRARSKQQFQWNSGNPLVSWEGRWSIWWIKERQGVMWVRELRGDLSGNARSTVWQQVGDLAQSLSFTYECIETKQIAKKVLRRDAFCKLNAQGAFYDISSVLLTDRITRNRFFLQSSHIVRPLLLS